MRIRKQLLAGMLAGLLALAASACQVEDFEGDPLEEGGDDGIEQDDTWDDGEDDGFDDGTGDDA